MPNFGMIELLYAHNLSFLFMYSLSLWSFKITKSSFLRHWDTDQKDGGGRDFGE